MTMSNIELLNNLLELTIWLPIKDYPNYQISIDGRVKNIKRNRILRPTIGGNGYYHVELYKKNQSQTKDIHRLVAMHFIPNIKNDDFVDHKNNDKLNNTISNLRWASNQQNQFNATLNCKNTSGVRGISLVKSSNRWRATIKFNNKKIHIGNFINIDDAKIARQKIAAELFGEFFNE